MRLELSDNALEDIPRLYRADRRLLRSYFA